MSIVYSYYSDALVDTDYHEVVWLEDGDAIPVSDEKSLLRAYFDGLIPDATMKELGFENKELGMVDNRTGG
jgi:hypothetical protein